MKMVRGAPPRPVPASTAGSAPHAVRATALGGAQLMHANSGVEKGLAGGGQPVEVMGLMLGRPDTEANDTLIVTDVRASRRQ